MALTDANITAFADTVYGGAATVDIPFRRARCDRSTRKFAARSLFVGQKAVTGHTAPFTNDRRQPPPALMS